MDLTASQINNIKNIIACVCFGTFGNEKEKDYWKGADINQREELRIVIKKIKQL